MIADRESLQVLIGGRPVAWRGVFSPAGSRYGEVFRLAPLSVIRTALLQMNPIGVANIPRASQLTRAPNTQAYARCQRPRSLAPSGLVRDTAYVVGQLQRTAARLDADFRTQQDVRGIETALGVFAGSAAVIER